MDIIKEDNDYALIFEVNPFVSSRGFTSLHVLLAKYYPLDKHHLACYKYRHDTFPHCPKALAILLPSRMYPRKNGAQPNP